MAFVNRPLPDILCDRCNQLQMYRGQKNCLHCEEPLISAHVALQLEEKARSEGALFEER